MIISKSDLYKTEWLDVVFAKRNKGYGAYELRRHNASTINKAMVIAFTAVTALVFGLSYVVRAKNTLVYHRTVVEVQPVLPPPEDKKIHEIKHTAATHKATAPVVSNPVPVVTEKPVTIEPKKIDELEKADVGPVDVNIPGDGTVNEPGVDLSKNGSKGDAPKVDESIHEGPTVDIEPEPVGGMAAWNKFLQKNMKYPAQAVDAGKSGRVYLSFVVEKDGHITDVTVIRGQGYGLDDEATRVLKLAPAWRPGMQHSRPVRVRYTLPFNFTLDQ